MTQASPEWEARCSDLWSALDEVDPQSFVARLDALASELPEGSSVALFEQACARDTIGHSDQAEPFYRAALAAGLNGVRRRRANIQLASSLRNLGKASEAAQLLEAEALQPTDELDGAVRAFLALALADLGREREALQVSLSALALYLPRYNRSLARYAAELVAGPENAA